MPLPARTKLLRQKFTVTITTRTDTSPWNEVRKLADPARVAEYDIESETVGPEEVLGVNAPRLVELAVWVAGEDAKRQLGLPSEWVQSHWLTRRPGVNSCGTACCIAGKVALDAGGVPFIKRYSELQDQNIEEPLSTADGRRMAEYVRLPGEDRSVEVREFAKTTLGLTDNQASRLFAGTNDLRDILGVIKELVGDVVEPAVVQEPAAAAPAPVPTRRRRRRSAISNCTAGEACNWCYEDVPVDGAESSTVGAPPGKRRTSAWRSSCAAGTRCGVCYEPIPDEVPF